MEDAMVCITAIYGLALDRPSEDDLSVLGDKPGEEQLGSKVGTRELPMAVS